MEHETCEFWRLDGIVPLADGDWVYAQCQCGRSVAWEATAEDYAALTSHEDTYALVAQARGEYSGASEDYAASVGA